MLKSALLSFFFLTASNGESLVEIQTLTRDLEFSDKKSGGIDI